MTEFVAAESGIRQLHARFLDAVWRKDSEAFANCFATDGEWKLAGLHLRGRDEIGSTFAKLLGVCQRVMILPGIPLLEVGRGEATGRVHCAEFAKLGDGTSAFTMGVYYDRYIEEDVRWLFKWRHFSLQYRGPIDLSAAFVNSPDYGPPPGMPGPDEPTITRRKATD